MYYHVWTAGCQMNVADSQRVASVLEKMGYEPTSRAEFADIVVVNTCVVRQSAEDKAHGRLSSLKINQSKQARHGDQSHGLSGRRTGRSAAGRGIPTRRCLFSPFRSTPAAQSPRTTGGKELEERSTHDRFNVMDGELTLPLHERGRLISAHVPVVYGCSHACSFCVIPFRRGVERSRPMEEIVAEIESLTAQGVKEVTLLGQIVDRYGRDIEGAHSR